MRRSLFYAHWLIGLIAGTLLMVIGASGAVLTFEDEILDALNPGVRLVSPAGRTPLSPADLLAVVQGNVAGKTLGNLTVYAEPGRSAKVMLQAERGPRPAPIYVDPYTGRLLGPASGQAFFEWTERLHRFLLLPREAGRIVAGTLSVCLLLLLVSGVYLRWPARVTSLREWLGINPRLRGRPLLWSVHAVLATWAVPVWLVLAGTGIYWAFDCVRSVVDGAAGVQRQVRSKPPAKASQDGSVADLHAAWVGFEGQAGSWNMVRLAPARAGARSVEIVWLPADAAHERALNRMQLSLLGEVRKDERFVAQSSGRRALAAIYPLHMGRYFGLPGQLVVAFGALVLPLLGLTGWWLYLQRRWRARQSAREMQSSQVSGTKQTVAGPAILVAFASQSGHAERLAVRTARQLQAAGQQIVLRSLAQMQPLELAGYPQALFVVSTFGDGQAPDGARGFARALAEAAERLPHLNYAVLALGNRQYPGFCAFGKFLHERLQQLGAMPQAALHTVCETQTGDYREWFAALRRFGVQEGEDAADSQEDNAVWMCCLLAERHCLNPGSQGAPLYEVQLKARDGEHLPQWEAGALIDVLPRHPVTVLQEWTARFGLDAGRTVVVDGARMPLMEALACRQLPDDLAEGDVAGIDGLAGKLPLLAPRRYSVASLVSDGSLQLIVRQHIHGGKIGLASGWLTEYCQPGAELSIRLLANPAFGVTTDELPCLFIGAGSGLAGLRGLLRERVRLRLGRNWLVLGERNASFDMLCAEEFESYRAEGWLEISRVFSRDTEKPGYVQDCLRENAEKLCRWVAEGGHVHVCGSRRGMAEGVDAVLRELLGAARMDELAAAGRYRRDVY